jgi:hypothetical protein
MSYFRSGDPLADFDRWDREQNEALKRLPVCEKCRRRIQDDDYYDVHGEILCEDCMKDKYRRSVEDYCFSD